MSGRRFVRTYLVVVAMLAAPGALVFVSGRASPARADAALIRSALAQAETARTLYEERCASCHGASGEGTSQGPVIVGLGPAFYDFMMSTGRMPLDQPTEQASRRRPVLTPDQIDAITTYLVSLSSEPGIPVPQVDPTIGSLSQGEQVYQSECAACHGTTGLGGAVGPRSAPNLHQATATQIAEAVRIGPSTMPVFSAVTIPDGEMDSLVRYVLYLRNPVDRGGASLNRAGPLIEGFVALLVGLGLIVVITRFIGERS